MTAEGFPITYQVFDGSTNHSESPDPIVAEVEVRHGDIGRVWVFDVGVVS